VDLDEDEKFGHFYWMKNNTTQIIIIKRKENRINIKEKE